MGILSNISGKEAVKIFQQFGYTVDHQTGSHIILYHESMPTLSVPNHKELAPGLLRGLITLTLEIEILKEDLMDIQAQTYVTGSGQAYEVVSKTSPLQSKLFQVYQLNEVCNQLGIRPP